MSIKVGDRVVLVRDLPRGHASPPLRANDIVQVEEIYSYADWPDSYRVAQIAADSSIAKQAIIPGDAVRAARDDEIVCVRPIA